MKHTYRLTCFFLAEWRLLLLGGPLLAAAQLLYTWTVSADLSSAYLAFEACTRRPVYTDLFCALLTLTLLAAFVWLRRLYRGRSRAAYALLTLPGPRAAIPFAAVIALALCVAALAVCQMLSLLGCAALWQHHAAYAVEATQAMGISTGDLAAGAVLPIPARANGLFLALLRSSFGRVLIPQTALGAATLVLIGLTLCALTVQLAGIPSRGQFIVYGLIELAFLCPITVSCLETCTSVQNAWNSANWPYLILLAAAITALLFHAVGQYQYAKVLP